MSLFRKNKKEEKEITPQSPNRSAAQINDDDLLNIAGGQAFHSELEEKQSLEKTIDVLNKYQ